MEIGTRAVALCEKSFPRNWKQLRGSTVARRCFDGLTKGVLSGGGAEPGGNQRRSLGVLWMIIIVARHNAETMRNWHSPRASGKGNSLRMVLVTCEDTEDTAYHSKQVAMTPRWFFTGAESCCIRGIYMGGCDFIGCWWCSGCAVVIDYEAERVDNPVGVGVSVSVSVYTSIDQQDRRNSVKLLASNIYVPHVVAVFKLSVFGIPGC